MSVDTRVVSILLGNKNKKDNRNNDYSDLFKKNISTDHSIRPRQRTVTKNISLSGMWGMDFNVNILKAKKNTGVVFFISHYHKRVVSNKSSSLLSKKREYRVIEEKLPDKEIDTEIFNAKVLFESIDFLGINNCFIHVTSNVFPPTDINLQAIVLAISRKGIECQNKQHLPKVYSDTNSASKKGTVSGISIRHKHINDYIDSYRKIIKRIVVDKSKYERKSFRSLIRKIELFVISVRGYGLRDCIKQNNSYLRARYAFSVMLDLLNKNRDILDEFENIMVEIEKDALVLINKTANDEVRTESSFKNYAPKIAEYVGYNMNDNDENMCGGLNRF